MVGLPAYTGGSLTAYFMPSAPPWELDFGAWLAQRSPLGAATVPVLAPGTHSLFHLPRVREPALSFVGHRRRGAAPAFHAAYSADIQGMTPRELAALERFPCASERSARQHIRDGRLVGADLGAWPWAVVDGQPLPRNWWADDAFALALQDWAARDLHPLALGAGDQGPQPRRFTAAARLPVA